MNLSHVDLDAIKNRLQTPTNRPHFPTKNQEKKHKRPRFTTNAYKRPQNMTKNAIFENKKV